MPVTHGFTCNVADDSAEANAGKVLPSHWNAGHTVSVDLATEVTGTLDPSHVPGVATSVSNSDGSLTISPTTGAVVASINLAHTNTWTITQGITATDPSWKIETTSTSSSPSGPGGYVHFRNPTGLSGIVGTHNAAFSGPGTFFLADQITVESFLSGGMAIGAWGTNADVVFFTADGSATAREAFRIKDSGTTVFAAGSASAGTAPVKFTSGTLMSSAEAGAVEFNADKFYGSITTGPARKEFTLNDAALTSTRVPFATTNGRLTDSANLTFDASAGITVSRGTGGFAGAYVNQTANGTGDGAIFQLKTNNAEAANISATAAGFTPSGLFAAAGSFYYGVGAGGTWFGNTAASVFFFTGGTATTNERASIDANGNFAIGRAALATNATNGFLYIPTCAGAPSGTPTSKTGRVPIIYDTTNNKIYIYNGAWKSVALA